MVKKIFSKKATIVFFIFIFFITNLSYSVKAMPQYTNDGSWVKIYRDMSNGGIIRTDYDTQTKSDLIDMIYYLIGKSKYNIFIEDGDYYVDKTLNIDTPGVKILGQSDSQTRIIQTKDCITIRVNVDNVYVGRLKIDSSSGNVAFHAQNVNYVTLEGCTILGSTTSSAVAFYGTNATKSEKNNLINNKIYSNLSGVEKNGVVFYGQNNGTVNGNYLKGSRIGLRVCDNSVVDGNTVENSGTSGILVTIPANNNTISSNTIKTTTEAGIKIVKEDSGTLDSIRADGMIIKNNTIYDSKYFGIEVRNVKNASINNNTISKIDYQGIYLLYSDNATIENNTVSDYANGVDNINWNDKSAGIFLDDKVTYTKIMKNTISNNKFFGIRIEKKNTNINNTIYSDNNINDSTSGSLQEYVYAAAGDPGYTNILEKDTVTDKSISLKWIKMNSSATYKIRRDGDDSKIKVIVGTETFVDTGLEGNKNYTYQISIGDNKWSNGITIQTLPSPPGNLKISDITVNSIIIIWDRVDLTPGYEVEADGVIHNVVGESYNHTDLSSDSEHTYRVRVKDGEWSAPVSGRTKTSITSGDIIPQNLRVAATTETSIRIVWDKVDSAPGYEVKADDVIVTNIIDESYEHTGLSSDSEHTYRVRIKDGQWSVPVSGRTKSSINSGDIIPQNLRIAATTENSIQIVWTEVNSDTEYDLEVDGIVVKTIGNKESYEHTGLLRGSTHKYRVRIKNGQWSEPVWGTTLDLKTPEVIVSPNIETTPVRGTSSSKIIKKKNDDNDEYDKVEIYFGNINGFSYDNPLLEKVQVDMLNRIFFCKIGENYYLGVRAWKDNKLKREIEYKLNLTSENKLIFNKIDDKVNDINYEIKEIMIKNTGEHLFYSNDFENVTLSKYIIYNGYVISIDDIKMKSNKNKRYNISESFSR